MQVECPICLENIDTECVTLSCKHKFHKKIEGHPSLALWQQTHHKWPRHRTPLSNLVSFLVALIDFKRPLSSLNQFVDNSLITL